MDSLERSLKKTKRGVRLLIVGLIFTTIFIILILFNHMRFIKVNDTYKNFSGDSDYEIIYKETNDLNKYQLFAYEDYHFYGLGIKNVGISYKGVFLSLETILQEKYLNLEELLADFTLIYNSQNISKYQSDKYLFTIIELYENYKEVIISSL